MHAAVDLSTEVPFFNFEMPIWGCFIIAGVCAYIGIASFFLQRADVDEHVSWYDPFPSTSTVAFFAAVVALAPPVSVLLSSLA